MPASSAPITSTRSRRLSPAAPSTTSTTPILRALNGIEQLGVESRPRFKYRTRLGWSDGTWSVTGFMNYESHFFHTPVRSAECQLWLHRVRRNGWRAAGLREPMLDLGLYELASRATTRSICRWDTTPETGPRTSICATSASSSWCRTSWIRIHPTRTRLPPRRCSALCLRRLPEPVRPHDLDASAKDVLGGTTTRPHAARYVGLWRLSPR